MRALITLVATVALLSLHSTNVGAQGRPAGVQTETIEVKEMAETVMVFGQVVAERESNVATRVGGIVIDVPILVGSKVSAGDVVAQLDSEFLELQLRRAESGLTVAESGMSVVQARVERAQRALDRAQNLVSSAAISEASLEDRMSDFAEATGALQEAEARIAAARNDVAVAEYSLRNATIVAPFDGIVLEVTAEIGQYANSGSQIATLLDVKSMEVQADVPSRLIEALEPGRDVSAETDTGGALDLELRAVLPTEFSSTRTRPVRFSLSAPDSTIAVGQSVTLEIPTGPSREVTVVPKDALVQARGGWSAFVNQEGAAAPRTVEIGAAVGEYFEVISGLAAGDEVVVRGNERLRPGQAIAPMGAGQGGGWGGGGGRPASSGEGQGEGRPANTGGGEGRPTANSEGSGRPAASNAENGPQSDAGEATNAPANANEQG